MTEADALDLALPILERAGLTPAAIRVLTNRRRALSEVLFVHCDLDTDGGATYLVGNPADPIRVAPRMPANMLMLHSLIATGTICAADWDDNKQPVDTVGRKLDRAINELRPYSETLYRAIYPLDRAVNGCFHFARRHGSALIVTSHVGLASDSGRAAIAGDRIAPTT